MVQQKIVLVFNSVYLVFSLYFTAFLHGLLYALIWKGKRAQIIHFLTTSVQYAVCCRGCVRTVFVWGAVLSSNSERSDFRISDLTREKPVFGKTEFI
jgi:hypothetical protein